VTTASKLPPFAIPVDVLRRDKNIFKMSKVPHLITSATKEKKVKWYERAPAHLEHLIGNVSVYFSEQEMKNLITSNSRLKIASDGGHEPLSGISTFRWVVAVNTTILATGKGPAQVHPSLAELFQLEGYGLTSASLFIQNMI
jgi:hypothetical protein